MKNSHYCRRHFPLRGSTWQNAGQTIILLNTGWWRRWNDYDKYKNADDANKLLFPGYSAEAVGFLVENKVFMESE
ncbi:MAG: cyclase family protein [Candidatus Scalindua sp.]